MPSLGDADVLVIDRAGRVVFAHGHTGAATAGQVLAGFDPDQPVERWLELLPAHLRAAGNFDPVRLDDRTVGAMIVMPERGMVSRTRPVASTPASEADATRSAFVHIVGRSAALLQVIHRAGQLARHRVPVLIHGETGVGKELLARAMHGAVDFAAPFIVFDCGAVPRDLIGAELFGHVKGAFTGATAEGRLGRFELANGGTLCLDEIGELPLDIQPILLRALEEGVIYRLGDPAPRRVSVRLVAMTNRDLREEAAAGRFRRDLFYRINVTGLVVPPLRDRPGDVEILIAHFNRALAVRHGVAERRFGPEVIALLDAYPWPGNVRELRNLVESLLLASDSADVSIDELPFEMRGVTETGASSHIRLADVEHDAILQAIQAAGGNLSKAARSLDISRSTLHRHIRRDREG